MEEHLTYGTGPRYAKIGGRVIYSIDDLQVGVARATIASTADILEDGMLATKPHWAIGPARARLDAEAGQKG